MIKIKKPCRMEKKNWSFETLIIRICLFKYGSMIHLPICYTQNPFANSSVARKQVIPSSIYSIKHMALKLCKLQTKYINNWYSFHVY